VKTDGCWEVTDGKDEELQQILLTTEKSSRCGKKGWEPYRTGKGRELEPGSSRTAALTTDDPCRRPPAKAHGPSDPFNALFACIAFCFSRPFFYEPTARAKWGIDRQSRQVCTRFVVLLFTQHQLCNRSNIWGRAFLCTWSHLR
jgi:hypothetical protein